MKHISELTNPEIIMRTWLRDGNGLVSREELIRRWIRCRATFPAIYAADPEEVLKKVEEKNNQG